MNVLVIAGAGGNLGRRTAIDLFRSGSVGSLRVTARDRDEATNFAARFSTKSSTSVTGSALDITSPDLADAFAGYDVVVNCAGPGYALEEASVRAAVSAGVNYVSLCDDDSGTEEALDFDDAARAAGISVVSGCGLSPGITSFLIEAAAGELDEVTEVQIAVGASSADSDGYASALHLTYSLSREARFLSEGEVASEKAGTAPKLVYFPPPVGWVETFLLGHPEIATVPRSRPNLSTVQFRLGLTERVVMDMLRGARASGLLRSERARRMWLAATWRSRGLAQKLPPRGAPWTAARVDVHGRVDGTATNVSLAVVDHLVNLAPAAMAEATLALGRGEAKEKGVGGPEDMFDGPAMLQRLSRRGIRTARLESELV